ncbi:MAG: hypothetical protein P8Z80_19975 [Pseudolabrys sp.]
MKPSHLTAALVAANLALAAFPLVAAAQQKEAPKAPKPTVAAVQKVVKMIGADKAKLKIYCDMADLSTKIDEAEKKKDTKAAEAIADTMDTMAEKLGPEYVTLMDGLQELPENAKEGEAIAETLAELDGMCEK